MKVETGTQTFGDTHECHPPRCSVTPRCATLPETVSPTWKSSEPTLRRFHRGCTLYILCNKSFVVDESS